jgi:hypothetical protein
MWQKLFFYIGFLTVLLALAAMMPIAAKLPKGPHSTRTRPQLIRVDLSSDQKQPVSGRLLIFAIPKAEAEKPAHDGKVTYVGANPFRPNQVAVAAQEVHHLVPGHSVVVDADVMAFPKKFSRLKRGSYDVQAVLDFNHDNNYNGRDPGDLVSAVTTVTLGGGAMPDVKLTRVLKGSPIWQVSNRTGSNPRQERPRRWHWRTSIRMTCVS